MEQHESEGSPKRRVQGRSGKKTVFIISIVILCIVALFYVLYPEPLKQFRPANPVSVAEQQSSSTGADGSALDRGIPDARQSNDSTHQDNSAIPESTSAVSSLSSDQSTAPPTAADSLEQSALETKSVKKGGEVQVCQQLSDNIRQFFNTLDSRAYIHEFQINQKSSKYFPELIQKLIDNPPVVTGETDDLFTILQNTAHFFRIIGKKNILILKGILDREKDTFEEVLADFYRLTRNQDCLKDQFDLTIEQEPLYQYAGFFLNTMGGRLYLFRRDSMSRMVVNYYAILFIDRANREGRNKYGIELNRAIDSLIADIESSKAALKLRDTYLDSLYAMKEKYQ